ncbi:acriflavin resistance protein [Alkaliphilus metalliredigens QYMF]|uniref:Acriflavin resistance protein n=1 Tax=Alkaliphilus metalliredigens (strain QYMF) TaxID=293826 RepID=A6TU84_ALKMQ|nr:efflux RND transporter permease subunit [Alkaliphilus metalliredigens]ABR49752.1 acriflavin resistance protein [Alkaliphilus metalliredigens QYMF]
MRVSKWAVNRYISVLMVIAGLLLLGGVSLSRLPMDLLPHISIPVAVVSTQYPGAGPLEIEGLVTRPVEEAVATVHNVKNMSSSSSEGNSIVIIEFNQGTDMDFATLQMREKIDLIKGFLPDEVTDPMVLRIDPNALPIMVLGLSGTEDLSELQSIVESQIKPKFERLEGVASVSVTGGYEEVVEIEVDPNVLTSYGITMEQIATIIRAENINLPGGEIQQGGQNILLRTIGAFENIGEIENLPILLPTGIRVYLKDISQVQLTTKDIKHIAKVNGEPSIRITIQKQPVANTVQVANRINQTIQVLEEEIKGIQIVSVIDQSRFITRSIGNVGRTAAFGGVLAVCILYLFLGNVRTTLVIALSIPISIVTTFALMYFSGMTLNLLSLGGFALGVGMLVDNGIVVLENIYRFREEGNDPEQSAILGTEEVAMAVTASTLTTLAVFLPIVFVEGMTAQVFREMALTVTFSLLASLGVSLTLVPMLASKLMKKNRVNGKRTPQQVLGIFHRFFKYINEKYGKILSWSLSHRKTILFVTFLIFTVAILLASSMGAEYFPSLDEGTFSVNIRLPQSATLQETEAVMDEVEGVLTEYEEIEVLFTNVGGGDVMSTTSTGSPNRGSIDGRLVAARQRSMTSLELVDEIRTRLANIAGAEISVSADSFMLGAGFGGAAVDVSIKGDDLETLESISRDFIEIIKGVEGTREVSSNFTQAREQIEVHIDRETASFYGVQSVQVAMALRNTLTGITATRARIEGKEVDVLIRGENYLRESTENIMQLQMPTLMGSQVPIDQLAEIRRGQGPNVIRRMDQVRNISVRAALFNRNLSSVVADIEEKIKDYSLPAGYSYEFKGENEQLEEAIDNLTLAVILAIMLVYMILAAQFQSFLHPFTIMMSVPLAFSGGIIALFLAGISINVPGGIGAIVLAGIVVNNGIVLIDYINTLRDHGTHQRNDSIIIAGKTRLRPIMMTTLTTVLGLLPLAIGFGEGAEVQQPIAVVVIGGLSLATLLTLVVIPVMYSVLDDIAIKVRKER